MSELPGRRRIVFTVMAAGTVSADQPDTELAELAEQIGHAVQEEMLGNASAIAVVVTYELGES